MRVRRTGLVDDNEPWSRDLRQIRVLHVIASGGLYGAERVLIGLARSSMRAMGSTPAIEELLRPAHPRSSRTRRSAPGCAARPSASVRRGALPAPSSTRPRAWVRTSFIRTASWATSCWRLCRIGYVEGIRVVATVHGYTETTQTNRTAWYGRLDRALLHRLDAVVFVHDGAARGYGIDVNRLQRSVVIDNGILVADDRRRAMGSSAPGLAAKIADVARGRPVVLSAGRLSPEKGQRQLVEAIARLRRAGTDVVCVLLGDGACRADLVRQCAELRLGAEVVFMPGFSELDGAIFAEVTLMCLPSVTEGSPLVVLEAMAAGVPIVATRVGGVQAQLNGYRAYQLVPPADSSALARALQEMLCRPRAADAAAQLPSRFSSARMAGEYRSLYHQLLD